MSEPPWLTIVGLGEDGPDGLCAATRTAIDEADVVWGAKRHLALIPGLGDRAREWPVPFCDGVDALLKERNRRVVMLASGDPFWFGAGSVLAERLDASEWRAIPGVSTFSLAAARLGWPLESVVCLGLHAAPIERLRPHLVAGRRAIVLVRDGAAVTKLRDYLQDEGFAQSRIWAMERLGGPNERVRAGAAGDFNVSDAQAPVCVAIEVAGDGMVVPTTAGIPDIFFEHDGQFSKRPMRALTLSALAPRHGDLLWDIGAGSGAISIEWLLADASTRAIAIEANATRAARAKGNAQLLGVDRLQVVEARAPDGLEGLPPPQAVFVGGGLSLNLFDRVWDMIGEGARLVVNAVTLESEALLTQVHATHGGELLRIALSDAAPLGSRTAWKSAYPVTQWSVTR